MNKPLRPTKPQAVALPFADWNPLQRETPVAQWLVTFTDLVALLVCFFVLMFSMKELDTEAWDSVRGSFEGVFTLVTDEVARPPREAPEAERIIPKKGSVLPYLQQVLRQKLGSQPGWESWDGRYDRGRDELWYPWQSQAAKGGDLGALAGILMGWKNQIVMVAASAQQLPAALAAADDLRARGVLVLDEVRLEPALDPKAAGGVWLVVRGTQ